MGKGRKLVRLASGAARERMAKSHEGTSSPITYREAGVDIDAGNRLVEAIAASSGRHAGRVRTPISAASAASST